jgi:hypothetical protein
MKLYCTTYIDDGPDDGSEPGPRAWWDGTQAGQKQAVKNFKALGMRNIEPQQIEVPTDKPGLLEWLNERRVMP